MAADRVARGCHGLGPDHCCYQEGRVCPFLEMGTIEGRRWVCGLYRVHDGDWDRVHADPGYLEHVKPTWVKHGIRDCGDFGPEEDQCCWGDYGPSDEVWERTGLPAQPRGAPAASLEGH